MRSDMAKVIVERPRYGSRMRGEGKGYRRALQRCRSDELPKREGIKGAARRHTKALNEHLGPLRRYLRKQVGRPWDKVFAEICAYISRDNPVQDHVRDHVFDYVAVRVIEIDGVLHEASGGRPFPLARFYRYPLMYVCPRTGILKLVKRPSRRARRKSQNLPEMRIDVDHAVGFIRRLGVWMRVSFETFPKAMANDCAVPLTVADALQETRLTRAQAVRHYGRAVVVTEARPASRAEIRRYCEPLKAPNVVR